MKKNRMNEESFSGWLGMALQKTSPYLLVCFFIFIALMLIRMGAR